MFFLICLLFLKYTAELIFFFLIKKKSLFAVLHMSVKWNQWGFSLSEKRIEMKALKQRQFRCTISMTDHPSLGQQIEDVGLTFDFDTRVHPTAWANTVSHSIFPKN